MELLPALAYPVGPAIVAEVYADDSQVPYDLCYNWESGQTYAQDGYRVVSVADDGYMSREHAQRLYDYELKCWDDCWTEGEL